MLFVSKGNFLEIFFTSASVKCRVPAVKPLPVLHHSADYSFISFGIIDPSLDSLKIEYCISRCRGRMQPRKTTPPIFFLLCVLCFQKQPFRFFIFDDRRDHIWTCCFMVSYYVYMFRLVAIKWSHSNYIIHFHLFRLSSLCVLANCAMFSHIRPTVTPSSCPQYEIGRHLSVQHQSKRPGSTIYDPNLYYSDKY